MDIRSLTTVSFDLIGTLIDYETGVREWFRKHLRDHDRSDDAEALQTVRATADRLAEAQPELSFTALLPKIYGHVARSLELDTDETAALDFRDSLRDWPAFADAVPALRQLGERYRLVAVTDADQWGMEAMSRTLGEPFDTMITADVVGATKPDARVWETLLAATDARPGEILHCSASMHHDIASARAAGLATAWLERGESFGEDGATTVIVEPDLRVQGLAELVEYLCHPAEDREA
jgi:putative hydrolase of the HAD superfamily